MLRAAVNRDRINDALAGMYEGEQSRHDGGHAGIKNHRGMRSRFKRDHLILQDLGVRMIEARVNKAPLFVGRRLRASGHQVESALGRFRAGKNVSRATEHGRSRRAYRKAGIEAPRHDLGMRTKYGSMFV